MQVRWRGSGLAVPVFSLRTRRSVGVGEFLDIKRLVDVCCMAGEQLSGAFGSRLDSYEPIDRRSSCAALSASLVVLFLPIFFCG